MINPRSNGFACFTVQGLLILGIVVERIIPGMEVRRHLVFQRLNHINSLQILQIHLLIPSHRRHLNSLNQRLWLYHALLLTPSPIVTIRCPIIGLPLPLRCLIPLPLRSLILTLPDPLPAATTLIIVTPGIVLAAVDAHCALEVVRNAALVIRRLPAHC